MGVAVRFQAAIGLRTNVPPHPNLPPGGGRGCRSRILFMNMDTAHTSMDKMQS